MRFFFFFYHLLMIYDARILRRQLDTLTHEAEHNGERQYRDDALRL